MIGSKTVRGNKGFSGSLSSQTSKEPRFTIVQFFPGSSEGGDYEPPVPVDDPIVPDIRYVVAPRPRISAETQDCSLVDMQSFPDPNPEGQCCRAHLNLIEDECIFSIGAILSWRTLTDWDRS